MRNISSYNWLPIYKNSNKIIIYWEKDYHKRKLLSQDYIVIIYQRYLNLTQG